MCAGRPAAGSSNPPASSARSCAAAIPAGRAGCPGSRRRSGRGRGRRGGPGQRSPAGPRGVLVQAVERQLGQAVESRSRRARARRTRSPPARPGAVAPRTRGPGSRRHPATARRRRGRAAAAPRPPPQQAEHGKPDQEPVRGVPGARPKATLSASRCGCGKRVELVEHRRAELMQAAKGSSISASTPAIWATRKPDACARRSATAPSCRCPPRRG